MKKLALIALVLAVSFATAQDASKQSPGDRIDAVTKNTGIDDVMDKPWYLKLDVTLFDD